MTLTTPKKKSVKFEPSDDGESKKESQSESEDPQPAKPNPA